MFVTHTGKLGDPQVAIGIDDAGLRPCTTQRPTRRDQHPQPLIALRSGVVLVAFQRQAGGREFAQLNERRRSKVVLVVRKLTGIIQAKPQRADTERVMRTEQIVRLGKSLGRYRDSGPLRALQSTPH